MEDRSIIKPILDALDYFNNSAEEITHFYKIIDKFCVNWFNKEVNVKKFTNLEFFLIHDLLGEFIRFEENNKRIALWLMSINRVCYNYTKDLTEATEEITKLKNETNHDIDSTLITPILNEIYNLEKLHLNAGKYDTGESDIISNYLQWVMVYATIIYPTLDNKMDFYEKIIIDAMNFILREFIKQRSNSRRIAYLIMGIKEACKIFSLQNPDVSQSFLNSCSNSEVVIPGKDEELVKEILVKLKNEKIKQEEDFLRVTPDQFVNNTYEKLIMDLNFYPKKSVNILNKYIFDFTNKYLTYGKNDKITFIKSLHTIKLKNIKIHSTSTITSLKKSIGLLPENTKKWFSKELERLADKEENYIDHVIKMTDIKEDSSSKFKSSKLYIMVYLINKLSLLN